MQRLELPVWQLRLRQRPPPSLLAADMVAAADMAAVDTAAAVASTAVVAEEASTVGALAEADFAAEAPVWPEVAFTEAVPASLAEA